MRAQELSFIILAITLSMGVVNYWGGFSTSINGVQTNVSDGPQYNPVDPELDGITTIDKEGLTDADDVAESMSGWSMAVNAMYALEDLLVFLAIPYPHLVNEAGVPTVFAAAIQALFNAVEALGLLQFFRGVGLKTFK